MAKNKKGTNHIPECLDGPTIEAIAANTQLFPSGKIAVPKGKHVTLEFMPSCVVVHDPEKPPAFSRTKLGPIMYTHLFLPTDDQCRGMTSQSAMETGIVSKQMSYLLKMIRTKGGRSECWFCGKIWKPALTIEQAEKHLETHKAEGTK